jgi:uncharacterized protein (TIGR03118 family)
MRKFTMLRPVGCKIAFSIGLAFVLVLAQSTASAQYKIVTLVSNQAGKAPHRDQNLVNSWGLAFSEDGPIWVSDEGKGVSTLYNGNGVPQSLVVTVPWGAASLSAPGFPTGIVFNPSANFVVSANGKSGAAHFVFSTADGTISGWNPSVDRNNAIQARDGSESVYQYTGLAIAADGSKIYAPNMQYKLVDTYDATFTQQQSFTDSTIPAPFVPYGIRDIHGQLYVTYANQSKAQGGFVDLFSESGAFVKRLASNGPLKHPWGLALAPSNFGPASGALLVGNNTPGGTINAFNAHSGKFLGALKDCSGDPLVIDQLWGLEFGHGGSMNGPQNHLFFTAGPNDYANGRLGVIEFVDCDNASSR